MIKHKSQILCITTKHTIRILCKINTKHKRGYYTASIQNKIIQHQCKLHNRDTIQHQYKPRNPSIIQHYYKTQNWDTISSLYNVLNENHNRWLSQYQKLEVNTYVCGVIYKGEIVYDHRFSSWMSFMGMCSCVMMMYMCSRVAMFVCCWHNRYGCKRL